MFIIGETGCEVCEKFTLSSQLFFCKSKTCKIKVYLKIFRCDGMVEIVSLATV